MIPRTSDGFGFRESAGRLHKGEDIMYRRPKSGLQVLPTLSKHFTMPNGVPALAYEGGVVTKSGQLGTGGRVEIDHGNGLSTKYFHLKNIRVKQGDRVNAGDIVGTIFHNVSGFRLNHLHFEMLQDGRQFDPNKHLEVATKVEAPDQMGFLLNVGLAIGAGYLISKYVFK